MNYDALEVKEAIAHNIQKIVKDLFPTAKKEGREMRLGSLSGEKGRSLSISLIPEKNGSWFDQSTEERGDIFTLIQNREGISYLEALEYLGDKYTNLTKKEFKVKSFKKEETISYDLLQYTQDLSEWVKGYSIEERKVSVETLERYGVRTMLPIESIPAHEHYQYIAFPCFDGDDCSRISYVNVNNKETFRCVAGARNNLFGKTAFNIEESKGILLICEGQWDALSWGEAGIYAVSVPSGVANHKWIDEDYEYLKQFHTIYLSMDMDEKGQDQVVKIAQRLGVNRCLNVELPLKDASDMLQEGKIENLKEAYKNAKPIEPEEIREASSQKEKVWNVLNTDQSSIGDACFMSSMPWRLREHEYTLVFGYCGHAKSTWVNNQVAFEMSHSEPVMVASFEMPQERVIAQIMQALCGNKANKLGDQNTYDFCYDHFISPNLYFYDASTATPKHIIEVFTYAYKRLGIKKFIVDNVMTMDIDIESNKEQADAAKAFKNFKNEYPVTLILVAHPRKPNPQAKNSPPEISEIRGASEWADLSDNIITIWRNTDKEKTLLSMEYEGASKGEIMEYAQKIESGQVILQKHRLTGELALIRTWFDKDSKQFLERGMEAKTMITKEKAEKAKKIL